VPIFIGRKIFPVIVATVVFDEVNVQVPDEFEVGGTRAKFATEPRTIFRSTKGPVVGAPPVMVTVVDLEVDAQLKFAACVAVKVIVPRALGVRTLPEIVATAALELE